MSVFVDRLNKLRKYISNKDLALLIRNEKNIYYFTGFQKSEGTLLITADESYLMVDFRYYEAASKIVKNSNVLMITDMIASAVELLTKHNIKDLCLESKVVTISQYQKYLRLFNESGISLITDGRLDKAIENLRLYKSNDEINFIEEAQKITEKAYTEVLNFVKAGKKEKTIAIDLEYLMKKYGAEGISFDLITITGKKTSLPHGVPGEDLICNGDFFTMDIGALYNGYHSDMTRTVAVKYCNEKQKSVYNTVLNAQLCGLNTVKAGIKASVVDKTSRDIIDKAGYKNCFGHATGHGVGLDIHESPALSPKSETILSSGMVVTVEPGIYIDNQFGVRIEDMVLVTDTGYKNFTKLSKELIIV